MAAMHVMHVVGARPNFMKVAPVLRALSAPSAVRQTLVHTGQHYDLNMSEVFFQQLGLRPPDLNLEVGSGSHAEQTANIMLRLEQAVRERSPDLVLVYGDVNSTLAAALVSSKLGIRIGHVEAGLRSFDRNMPEEINRLLTDQVADLLFTPSEDGDRNLLREGVAPDKIHRVGNVMIDTLVRLLPAASTGLPALLSHFQVERFGLVTLHRPSNVDAPDSLASLFEALEQISQRLPLIFPVHPRTRERLRDRWSSRKSSLLLVDPVGYLDFLALQSRAVVVITDSGGIQEETTYLGVPCLTVRENTERPITVELGTNILVGREPDRLRQEVDRILQGQAKCGAVVPLWDGRAAERIAEVILRAG